MTKDSNFTIEVEAVRALAEWKYMLSEKVCSEAKDLAIQNGSAGIIKLEHYRKAAVSAAQELAKFIQETGSCDGNRKAA